MSRLGVSIRETASSKVLGAATIRRECVTRKVTSGNETPSHVSTISRAAIALHEQRAAPEESRAGSGVIPRGSASGKMRPPPQGPQSSN